MLYKHLGLFIFLTWSTQMLAMHSPDVNDDTNRIETLVKKLREIDPIDFPPSHVRELLLAEHLDFTERPEDISRLYLKVCHITRSPNGASDIWKATLAKDRPLAGLKVGDMIALKMTGSIPKPFKNSLGSLVGLEALPRLSHFKNLKTGEQPITDYFPNFYGVYYGEKMPSSSVAGEYPEHLKNYKFEKAYFRYEEMEWVDTTFDKKYKNSKIPDSVLFELMYGEWAGQFFRGLSLGDCKGDNYGLKAVAYKRVYHLGEDIYTFSSTEIPVRLDLEELYTSPHPTEKRFDGGRISICSFAKILSDLVETQNGNCFLNALFDRENDIFSLFKKHFSAYQIDQEEANNKKDAKHFYIDQKWVAQERLLPAK